MDKPTAIVLALVLAVVLSGCGTTTGVRPPVGAAPTVTTIADTPRTEDKAVVSPAATVSVEPEPTVTYAQVRGEVEKLSSSAGAQEIAEALTAIGAARVADQDRRMVDGLEAGLLSRLRAKVKSEVSSLHDRALKSSSYRDGYALARDAGAVLALYPLSDDPATVKEAEDLSFRQNDVMRRLDLIRRQRYNHWAAQQVESALKELRENKKNGRDAAITSLQVVDPLLLESSVASLYSYAVTEIVDKFKKDEVATVAKRITDPSVARRGLEDF